MNRVRLLALFSVIPLGALTTAGCFEVRKGHDDNVYICACDADCPYGYSCDGWSATCVTNVQTSGSGGRATGGSWGHAGARWRRRLGRRGRTRRDRRHGRRHGHGRARRNRRHGRTCARLAASAAPAASARVKAPAEPAAIGQRHRRRRRDQRHRRDRRHQRHGRRQRRHVQRSPATAGPALAAFPGHASRCHGTPALCRFSSECGAGGRCLNGACQPGCTSSTDCGTGDVCTGGYCQPSTTGGATCVFNFDCPANHTCVNGFCHGACSTDTDCPAHDMCSAGLCQPDVRPHPSCRSNPDCASRQDLRRRLLPQRMPHERRLLHLHDGDGLRPGRLLRDAGRGRAAVPAADRLQRRAVLLGRGLLLVATRQQIRGGWFPLARCGSARGRDRWVRAA